MAEKAKWKSVGGDGSLSSGDSANVSIKQENPENQNQKTPPRKRKRRNPEFYRFKKRRRTCLAVNKIPLNILQSDSAGEAEHARVADEIVPCRVFVDRGEVNQYLHERGLSFDELLKKSEKRLHSATIISSQPDATKHEEERPMLATSSAKNRAFQAIATVPPAFVPVESIKAEPVDPEFINCESNLKAENFDKESSPSCSDFLPNRQKSPINRDIPAEEKISPEEGVQPLLSKFILKRRPSSSKNKKDRYKLIELPPLGNSGPNSPSSELMSTAAESFHADEQLSPAIGSAENLASVKEESVEAECDFGDGVGPEEGDEERGSETDTAPSTDTGVLVPNDSGSIRGIMVPVLVTKNSQAQTTPVQQSKAEAEKPTAFYCLPCSLMFPSAQGLKGHVLDYHRESLETTAVLSVIKKGDKMVKYTAEVTFFYECPFCCTLLKDVQCISQHILASHKGEILQFKVACKKVPVKVMKVEPLLSLSSKFLCGYCKLSFTMFEFLKIHLEDHHGILECQRCLCFFNTEDGRKDCSVCEKRYLKTNQCVKEIVEIQSLHKNAEATLEQDLIQSMGILRKKSFVTKNDSSKVVVPHPWFREPPPLEEQEMWSSDSAVGEFDNVQRKCKVVKVSRQQSAVVILDSKEMATESDVCDPLQGNTQDDEYGVDALEDLLQSMKAPTTTKLNSEEINPNQVGQEKSFPNCTPTSAGPATSAKRRSPFRNQFTKQKVVPQNLTSNENVAKVKIVKVLQLIEEPNSFENKKANAIRLKLTLSDYHDAKPCFFPCLFCDKMTNSRKSLVDHMIIKHNFCPVCRDTFGGADHFTNHGKLRFFKCSSFGCNQTFRTIEQYARHEEFVHDCEFEDVSEDSRVHTFDPNLDEDMVPCFYCAEYFPSESMLDQHLIYEHNVCVCVDCKNYFQNGSPCKCC